MSLATHVASTGFHLSSVEKLTEDCFGSQDLVPVEMRSNC